MTFPPHGTPSDTAGFIAGELRALIGRLKRRLREEDGDHDMSLSQMAALGRLYRHGQATVSELARAEHVRPQSMGSTVAGMQARGWIETHPDPHDGRRILISLTPMARQKVEAIRAARNGWLVRAISERFDDDEQITLKRAIALLKRLADD